MPRVLTTKATIACPHGGQGTTTSMTPIWDIQGGFALAEGDTGVIKNCALMLCPCLTYTLQSMGLNASVIQGRKVILETDYNITNTGLPLLMTDAHTCMDSSTPAPLPPGQSAPQLSPALLDVTTPAVVAAPTMMAFSTTTQLPPTVVFTFTLTAAFPARWILTYLNVSMNQSADWTNSVPPGVVVSPSGGSWAANQVRLTLTVTLSLPFLSTLPPGAHQFNLTGVNQRGKFGLGVGILTVS
jgi:hypothetical protein